MSKKTIKKKFRDIIFGVLSFILALFLFADSVCILSAAFVVNENMWIDQMNSSNYYTDKADEIEDKLIILGNASGLPAEFFDNVVDPIQVTNDTNAYLDAYFDGKNEVVSSNAFKQKFNSELNLYIAENKATVDEANVEYLANTAEHIYFSSLEIPLFYRLSGYLAALKSILPFVIAGLSVLSAVIILILLFCNKWRHRAFKYYYFASAGTCLSLLAVSVSLSVSGGLKKIILESRTLYNMAVSYGTSVTIAFWAFTAFFFIVSVTLFFVYSNLFKKVSESD